MAQLTTKQIEAATLLKSIDVSDEVIDEIVDMIKDVPNKEISSYSHVEEDLILKDKLLTETDWRKKVSIHARLISNGLDN